MDINCIKEDWVYTGNIKTSSIINVFVSKFKYFSTFELIFSKIPWIFGKFFTSSIF